MRGLYAERPVLNRLGGMAGPGAPRVAPTSVTKPLLIDDLEQALRALGCGCPRCGGDLRLVHYQRGKDGRTGAPSGGYDDHVIGPRDGMR